MRASGSPAPSDQNTCIRVRVEFAPGDGRVKRKEDERKNQIAPSETLFVVGFKKETTQHGQDLEMVRSNHLI